VIYKYIWLDGYTPEQSLRSKIQVAEQHGMLGTNDQPPVGHLMVLQLNKQQVDNQTVY